MATTNDVMTDPGPERQITPQQILEFMEEHDRPVWTAASISDEFESSRPTVHNRLKELESDPRVRTMQVGNTKAYYLSDEDPRPIEEQHKDSIIDAFTDKFVGLLTAPWTAVHPNDGPAEAGDKIQIRVDGEPGRWGSLLTHAWENRREELVGEETAADSTQALISGELYAKPTVPIEHENYPDDYDLELNIGGRYKEVEGRSRPVLIAAGVKNYLIKPCDDAVFLKDVSVDWISPKGEGQEMETYHISHDDVEELLEERGQEEALENYQSATEPVDVEEPVNDEIPKPRTQADSNLEETDE